MTARLCESSKLNSAETACVGMADHDEPCPSVAVKAVGEPADIGRSALAEPNLAVVEQPSPLVWRADLS